MKKCPKCGTNHDKNGKFCSRSCANSRVFSEETIKKKSESAKRSKKVMLANTNPEKLIKLFKAAKQQNKDGKTVWGGLHTPEVIDKIKKTKKNKTKEWLESLDRKNKVEYRKACQFRFSLNEYPEEFNFALVEEFGWYRAKNRGDNPYGVSRDHMYSIKEGFENDVDPYYISHPANCRLMRQIDNKKKDTTCSITLEDLLKRVLEWDEKYNKNK